MGGDRSDNGPPRSLFGGPLSTRTTCARVSALDLLLKKQGATRDDVDANGQIIKPKPQPKPKSAGGSKDGQPRIERICAPPVVINSKKEKQKNLRSDLDTFDDLNNDGPAPKQKPKPKPLPPAAPKPIAGPNNTNGAHPSVRPGHQNSAPGRAAAGGGPAGRGPGSLHSGGAASSSGMGNVPVELVVVRGPPLAPKLRVGRQYALAQAPRGVGPLFRDDGDDRSMEVGYRQLSAEEKRSERLGRKEDDAEEIAETRRREEKMKRLKSKR
eukprot:gene20250-27003_t